MGLFIAIALLSVVVSLLVAKPLLLGGKSTAGDATGGEIYRDQLRQLDAEKEDGLISEKDAVSARTEIARRLLAVESELEDQPRSNAPGKAALILGLIVALGLPMVAGGVYLQIGKPGLPAQPLASRDDLPTRPDAQTAIAATEQHDGDLEDLVTQLEARLKDNPSDIDGWALLARSYITQGNIQKASDAYAEAIELTGGTEPFLRGEQAELQTIINKGTVSAEAKAGFEAVLAQDPKAPRARFYLGLAKAQSGQMTEAMTDWATLLKSAEPGAPWVGPVTERILAMAEEQGIDPAAYGIQVSAAGMSAPAPTPPTPPMASNMPDNSSGDAPRGPTQDQIAAAQDMSSNDQQAMINSMVTRLRARLDEGDGGAEGWLRLARAYGVLGKADEQLYAHRKAAELEPGETETQLALANALMDVEDGRVNKEAFEVLSKVLQSDPNNPEALWNLGRAAADNGNSGQAREMWSKLLGIVSDNDAAKAMVMEALDSLGG